jgi:PTS system mannose-specific IIB component
MIGLIIGAHGDFAPGLKSAGGMIFGEQPSVEIVQLLPSMGPEDLYAKYQEALKSLADCEEIIVLVDFWGGTPFNIASRVQNESALPIAILTGASMPMLVELYSARDSYKTAAELAEYLEKTAKEGVQIALKSDQTEDAADELGDLL